jgi:hypothetical protein
VLGIAAIGLYLLYVVALEGRGAALQVVLALNILISVIISFWGIVDGMPPIELLVAGRALLTGTLLSSILASVIAKWDVIKGVLNGIFNRHPSQCPNGD